MSPATKLKKERERTVKASGQDDRRLTITHKKDSSVEITWLCGDHRNFNLTDLIEQFGQIEMFADRWPGVWVTTRDSLGRAYAVKVENGRLYADSDPTAGIEDCVPWTNLRNALRATIKDALVNQQQQEGS